MAYLKSNKLFNGRELIAHAVAVDVFQGGKYIKSHEVNKDKGIESNFKLMLEAMHNPEKARVTVTDAHTAKAEEIIDYFEGLVFKAMTRKLSEFETKITELIKAEDINIKQKDYYFSNVIARSSKTMLDCHNSKLNISRLH